MNNGDDDHLTPSEGYPLANPGNKEGCRVVANMTAKLIEYTHKLEALRLAIAADPRLMGENEWDRIRGGFVSVGVDFIMSGGRLPPLK